MSRKPIPSHLAPKSKAFLGCLLALSTSLAIPTDLAAVNSVTKALALFAWATTKKIACSAACAATAHYAVQPALQVATALKENNKALLTEINTADDAGDYRGIATGTNFKFAQNELSKRIRSTTETDRQSRLQSKLEKYTVNAERLFAERWKLLQATIPAVAPTALLLYSIFSSKIAWFTGTVTTVRNLLVIGAAGCAANSYLEKKLAQKNNNPSRTDNLPSDISPSEELP